MLPREITCASCGAHYGAEQLRCPYCGSVNDLADEQEFMEDLGELRENLEKLPSETVSQEAGQAFRDVGRIIRSTVLVVLALCAAGTVLFLASRFLGAGFEQRREEERQEEYLWKQENFPRLDALYEAEDYDGLFELYTELMDGPVYEWEHYYLLEGLRLIRDAKEEIQMTDALLAEGESAAKRAEEYSAWVLQEELQLYFFDLRCKNKKDCAVILDRAAEVLSDLETRFALTEEEMEFFRKEAEEDYGYIRYKTCEEFLAERKK